MFIGRRNKDLFIVKEYAGYNSNTKRERYSFCVIDGKRDNLSHIENWVLEFDAEKNKLIILK